MPETTNVQTIENLQALIGHLQQQINSLQEQQLIENNQRQAFIDALQHQRTIETQELQTIIDLQKNQLADLIVNDWNGLVLELKNAGFYDWAAEAIASALTDPTQSSNLIDYVIQMKNSAAVGDRVGVLDNFAAIAMPNSDTGYKGFPPIKYAAQWQVILDRRNIPENIMSFKPFIVTV